MAAGEALTLGRMMVKKQNNLFDTNTNTFNFQTFFKHSWYFKNFMLFRNFHHEKIATDGFICMPDVLDKTFFSLLLLLLLKNCPKMLYQVQQKYS
jgi:hypothetical protein